MSTWHERLGHTNYKNILKMVKTEATNGLSVVDKIQPQNLCNKMHRSPFPKEGKELPMSVIQFTLMCVNLWKQCHPEKLSTTSCSKMTSVDGVLSSLCNTNRKYLHTSNILLRPLKPLVFHVSQLTTALSFLYRHCDIV